MAKEVIFLYDNEKVIVHASCLLHSIKKMDTCSLKQFHMDTFKWLQLYRGGFNNYLTIFIPESFFFFFSKTMFWC